MADVKKEMGTIIMLSKGVDLSLSKINSSTRIIANRAGAIQQTQVVGMRLTHYVNAELGVAEMLTAIALNLKIIQKIIRLLEIAEKKDGALKAHAAVRGQIGNALKEISSATNAIRGTE